MLALAYQHVHLDWRQQTHPGCVTGCPGRVPRALNEHRANRCNGTATGFTLYTMIDDHVWDLFAFAGHSPVLGAKVRTFSEIKPGRGRLHSPNACPRRQV